MDDRKPPSRGQVRELLAQHGHRPTKALGQNFLIDPQVVDRMVEAAGLNASSQVVEVGAGTGVITARLAATAKTVVAYEIDESLAAVLEDGVDALDNVEVRIEDASIRVLGDQLGAGEWTLVANLPFNIGTGVVLDALRHSPSITRLVVLVQREVADRLSADAGSKTYGLPSVIAGLHSVASFRFAVPPGAFEPRPSVESAVIVFDRVEPPAMAKRAIEIAGIAFQQRRKMVRRSLAGVFTDTPRVLATAGVDPMVRPEALAPRWFVAMAEAEGQVV